MNVILKTLLKDYTVKLFTATSTNNLEINTFSSKHVRLTKVY